VCKTFVHRPGDLIGLYGLASAPEARGRRIAQSLCLHASANELNLSASIAVYRPQAESFGGRFDGKFCARWKVLQHYQWLVGAGDN